MTKNGKKRYRNGRKKKGLDFSFEAKHVEFFQDTSAEREDNLDNYYVDNIYSENAISTDSRKAFFVGRTGVGKTAILEKVRRNTPPRQNVISIDPEDFAFKLMARSSILKQLTSFKVNLDLFYKTMWKYIFITEILKEIYGKNKKNWFREQIEKYIGDKTAVRAYQFLLEHDELESGLPFDQKIDKIVKKLEHSITAKVTLGVASIGYEAKLSKEQETEIHQALQQFEFSDLNYFLKHLDDKVLRKYRFIILVDDLDKNWIQNEIGINFTKCLFETIFDINNSKNLRLLVSLRTNLFNQLGLSQREKFIPYIDYISWKPDQIKVIIEKRFREIGINIASDVWSFALPKEVTVDGGRKFSAFEYLLKRSNMRPRDILFFISYGIKNSIGKNIISSNALLEAEGEYSRNRLEALEDEWRNPYLDIGKIFQHFHRCSYKMDKKDFFGTIESLTLEILEKEEAKSLDSWSWIIDDSYIDKKTYDAQKLVNLLYRVGFIGIKESPSLKVKYIHDGLDNMPRVYDDTKFYINPCYYRAISATFH